MMIKVILLLMICALPYVTCSTECVVDEIAVQQNLDLEKVSTKAEVEKNFWSIINSLQINYRLKDWPYLGTP